MNLRSILNKVYSFYIRELTCDFSLENFLDACVFLFSSFLWKVFGLPNFWEKRRQMFMVRRIEKKFHVRFVYRTFPPDVFWKDYFQIMDFFPVGKIVIEVGASIGVFAVVATKLYKSRKVVAIEPDKESFAYLLKNIKINNLKDEIIPLNLAAYDIDGEISLYKSGPYLTTTEQGNLQKCLAKK
jgi:hypothetical protein